MSIATILDAVPSIDIRPFHPGDAAAFRELNEAWIARHFRLEEPDRIVLSDPQGKIVGVGGHIFMVVDTGSGAEKPIGCAALLPDGPGVFELGKMTVRAGYRGQGIGRRLLDYAIAQARALGATTVVLASNAKLADAVHLYEAAGFRHFTPHAPSPYARSNVFMELSL